MRVYHLPHNQTTKRKEMKYAVRELVLGQRVQMSIRAVVAKTVFLFIAPVISILQHMVRNYGITIEFHLFTMQ